MTMELCSPCRCGCTDHVGGGYADHAGEAMQTTPGRLFRPCQGGYAVKTTWLCYVVVTVQYTFVSCKVVHVHRQTSIQSD